MASSSLNVTDFSEIKIILCVQGYSLEHQYFIREIGFWTKGISGSIPFNCKLNEKKLDERSKLIIEESEKEINGIRLKKRVEAGLALSEARAVLRTLYHLNSDSAAKYIGICSDDYINGLLFNAGLGSYVRYLDNLFILQSKQIKCPTNEIIRMAMKQYPGNYEVCHLHDHYLKNNEIPLCAKLKAEFIANFCLNMINSQEKDNATQFASIVYELNSISK